ncbi:MAG: exonuclease domain-containing protein [Alphaproteobacteria bacterium]|nr:exonuclease domain-containing protein [Alphaproteobacteria bacterium]
MAIFEEITKAWSIRRLAALALLLAGAVALATLAAIGWTALAEAPSRQAAMDLAVHLSAGAAVVIVLFAAIAYVLDRALAARAFDTRDLPARPEFYDYDIAEAPAHIEELAGRSLASLTFTVFDTETTGLSPSQGDEIISIAGVRVSAGRIDRENAFAALVDPGFPVPKPSIRFHGITDEMLAGKPAIAEVLPDFRAFVGDSILVAHNAAFDMRFLKLKEDASGVSFHQVVLDTLLLSVFLDRDAESHTLDAIAERTGIAIEGRHTALGDALATAAILLDQLRRLEDRGITTLGQAISASNEMTAVRKLQTRF